MGILTLPNKNLIFSAIVNIKTKRPPKDLMILFQIFYILVCCIFKSSDKIKSLGNNATLI